MSAQALAEALGGAIQKGDEWYGRCPIHNDSDPSVGIMESNGKLVWVCRAGCDQKALTAAILPILKSLNGTSDRSHSNSSGRPQIVAEYDYRDLNDQLVFQVVRMEPGYDGKTKTFFQRSPDGEGGWKKTEKGKLTMKGVSKILFHLSQWADSSSVIVVEGEKDVIALEALGLPATTNAGGAGKWLPGYNEALRGKRIAIIHDNDGPGRNHGDLLVRELLPFAEDVRCLRCPDPHNDVSDWIKAGATRSDILLRIKGTSESNLSDLKEIPNTQASVKSSGDERHWWDGLLVSEKGPRALLANALHAARKAPAIKDSLKFDSFTQKMIIVRDLPWGTKKDDPWKDRDDALFAEWLQHEDIRVGADLAGVAASTVAYEKTFDSLQIYLDSLVWDCVPRLHLFGHHLGATSTLSCDLIRYFMISAAARGLRPGCQVDHMLVLEGVQGARKSTALRTLFDPLDLGWFRDDLPALDTKDSLLQLRGAWCVEIAELEAISSKRADVERVKAFITRRVDSYRPPYGRRVVDVPRRTVFAGSTNESAYLKDVTGNRRFWPVSCINTINIDQIKKDREQLWAEAVAAFHMGEHWWVDDDSVANDDIREAQEARRVTDPWEDQIEVYLKGRSITAMSDLFHQLGVNVERQSQIDSNRIGRIIRSLGWTRKRFRENGESSWVYVADSSMMKEDIQREMDKAREEEDRYSLRN